MSSSSKNNNNGAVDQYQNLTRIDKNSGEKQEDIERNANAVYILQYIIYQFFIIFNIYSIMLFWLKRQIVISLPF